MRAYVRTSRNTGISMPWYLAIPAAACWLVVMLAVLIYGWAMVAVVAGVRAGRRAWQRHHPAVD